jgi:hypothetical protein
MNTKLKNPNSNLCRAGFPERFLLPAGRLLAGAVALVTLTGMAQAQSEYTGQLSAEQASLVKQTCTETMHIRQGYVQYDACTETLGRTLADRNEAERLARSYDACASATRKEGTPEFALCVLDQKKGSKPPDISFSPPGVEAQIASARETNRAFSESNAEQRRMLEENACARLGLVPGRASFGLCVTQLDVNLWSSTNPS